MLAVAVDTALASLVLAEQVVAVMGQQQAQMELLELLTVVVAVVAQLAEAICLAVLALSSSVTQIHFLMPQV
jgi:hypothetical protein